MVQHNQIFALAAGVVVHQHTRVLMEDLRGRGDDMSVADVQAGMQQLTAELAAAYKAAAVGDSEIKRVVVEYKSGPQGKAAVNARVVEANARLAEGHCDCAVCARAAVSIAQCVRERLAEQEYSSSAAVHVVERQAAEMGCSGEEAANGLQR